MPLNDQDIKYAAKKFNLPLKLVEKITETDTDTLIFLNELSQKDIKKEDVNKITFFTYIKLVVLRYSYDTIYSIEEKLYIAKTIYFLFLDLKKGLNHKIIVDKSGPSERKSQYLLLVAGLFYDVYPQLLFSGHLKYIAEGFNKEELRNLRIHVEGWIAVLKEIKQKKYLDPPEKSRKLLLKEKN